MIYDLALADRVRAALSDEESLRERKMFGGLAFMVNEKMVVCVGTGGGALLVRVSGDRDADYLKVDGARRAEMGTERSMGEGWITVDDAALTGEDNLRFWIDAVLDYNSNVTGKR
ncbi:RNA methyltransferase [Rhodococcoides trifolii]|uniref:RNA methyltransferase n=1 Tax=Rhodococcoides trifolii TaxID=908250 RepID=A0A917CXP3_9NOCA|nr:TfoX/Sxy family protein [Rhodococcus trifolii]GGF99185.1 RNA methyltransferase [Rhodococcus trifolii]